MQAAASSYPSSRGLSLGSSSRWIWTARSTCCLRPVMSSRVPTSVSGRPSIPALARRAHPPAPTPLVYGGDRRVPPHRNLPSTSTHLPEWPNPPPHKTSPDHHQQPPDPRRSAHHDKDLDPIREGCDAEGRGRVSLELAHQVPLGGSEATEEPPALVDRGGVDDSRRGRRRPKAHALRPALPGPGSRLHPHLGFGLRRASDV